MLGIFFLVFFLLFAFRIFLLVSPSEKKQVLDASKTEIHSDSKDELTKKQKKNISISKARISLSKGNSQFSHLQRGSIYDRNGKILAYSRYAYNIYLDTRVQQVLNLGTIARVSEILNIPIEKIKQKQKQKGRLIFLQRLLNEEKALELYQLKSPHFLLDKMLYRHYPANELLGQVLGFMGHDGKGLAGLEQGYNNILIGKKTSWEGEEIHLTLFIDKTLQQFIEQRLAESVKAHKALAGTVIVQDIHSGGIIAMANAPQFNLNSFYKENPKLYRNNAVSSLVEPGSIFKAFFAAYLLEHEQKLIQDFSYTSKGYHELSNGEIIKGSCKGSVLGLEEIIQRSCNAGMIALMENISARDMYAFLQKFSMSERTGIDLPAESKNIIPKIKNWGLRTKATLPLGQGLALTPMKLINTFSSLINGGVMLSPRIVEYIETYKNGKLSKRQNASQGYTTKPLNTGLGFSGNISSFALGKTSKTRKRLIKEETSKALIDLLQLVVLPEGTGKVAMQAGYKEIFGKTGTSQIVDRKKGGYHINRYNSIFAAGYPAANPKFSVLVLLHDPKKSYHGGGAAASLFAETLDQIVKTFYINNEREKKILIASHAHPASPEELFTNGSSDAQKEYSTSLENASLLARKNKTIYFSALDTMPNLNTLSLRKALQVIDGLRHSLLQKNIKLSHNIQGSGFVSNQYPQAGQPISKNTTIYLLFDE